MLWVFLGFAALLSSCGLRYVDCLPSFTQSPNSGNPTYVADGASSVNLAWNYNDGGFKLSFVDLLYIVPGPKSVIVARKMPDQDLIVYSSSGYTAGRISFTGTATFQISNIVQSDSRTFQCRIMFSNSSPPEYQDNAVVVVVVPPSIQLRTLKSPVEIKEGTTFTLLCVATGNPKPSYTWTKDSTTLPQTSNSNYTITSANRDHAGNYTCTATVTAPTVITNPATYTVAVKVKYKPQVTALYPNQTALNDGSNAFFTCEAVAYPTSIEYFWFKDGIQITSDPNGDYFIEPSGSGSRLRVSQIKKNSAGRYSCSGRNSEGTGTQVSVYFKVYYAPENVTVTFTNPQGVKEGQSATLTCYADGYPLPSFSWKFNGNPVNGAQQNTLVLTNARVENAGNYTCVAGNFRGSKELTREVHVRYKPTVTTFTTGTPDNSVVQGTTVTLTCSANGYPAPQYTIRRNNVSQVLNNPGKYVINNILLVEEDVTYSCVPQNAEGIGPTAVLGIKVQVPPEFPGQSLPSTKQTKKENETQSYSCIARAKPLAEILWVLNGVNLTHTPPYNISTSFQPIQNSKLFDTLSYLTIHPLSWKQNGSYSCIAFNPAGQKRQSTLLEVQYRPVVQSDADHPKNLTLAEGATATFTCKTIGNPETLSHRWQFNGVDIPGSGCGGCISTTYTKAGVSQLDAGWYSCIGTNVDGDGPPASAQLLIKHPPRIIRFPQDSYTVNETNNVTMVCGADGVPEPDIIWVKTSSDKEIGKGEHFTIANTSGSDDGTYRCTARNELGSDSKEVTLNVQTRPTITTSFPMATNIPGSAGEEVKLTCIVRAKPSAQLTWKRDLNTNDLNSQIDDKVKSISTGATSIEMTVVVSAIDEEFYCVAVNLLGSDSQKYRIRERGEPDAPRDIKLIPFQVPNAKTVSVNVSWTPGYNGGFRQEFLILYRKTRTGGDFTEESVGNPPSNMHTVQKLSPSTDYEFKLEATNERGKGPSSTLAQVQTKDSAVPPDRGTVKATRSSDEPTVIVVTWTVSDEQVTKLSLDMQEGGNSVAKREVIEWTPVPGAQDMSIDKTEFKVENLKSDKQYTFRMDMRRSGEEDLASCPACYVYSSTVPVGPIPGQRGDDGGLQNWMIAVIAAVAGVLLLCIVILCLCCFMRRKKAHGADRVDMSQTNTSSYVVGGPDVSRSLDTRPRSFGMESVEDDPFIEAHFASMQSMNLSDGKKKKPANGVNYGYLSQDSVQNQPEMLLNPGSRLSRNHPVAQSTGDLEAHSAYPARGPQRDFSTLPPYHEPPSFEEAMRQSGRKPKTRKSTGDLAGPGQGRHSGRRPRQTPGDEPTDSSDGEARFTPQRAAPPPPIVRHVESSRDDPGYATVDQGRVLGPRVLPQGLPSTVAPRNNGPLDATVPYALPHKKKSKKSRSEPSEPAIERFHPPALMYGPPVWRDSYKGWPPPQYTPEDRSPEEPMPHPRDLDLDDPSTLPPSERPPDLPPPMAMLPSNRSRPSYHDDPHDGLPEPPAFLRDVVYPAADGRDPRYDSDDPAFYQPPSPQPNRQRQPYVNIYGQLVRPSSRESDDFRRPESLRSSRDALTPEPEMPPRQWQPREHEPDDRGAPEINYVSYLV